MRKLATIIVLLVVLLTTAGANFASAQCATGISNLVHADFEYFGALPVGDHAWAGQSFTTDCAGQFLSVSFMVVVQLFDFNGIRPLTAGDTVTCTVMDDQHRPIASIDQVLTVGNGTEQVNFDFSALELGLAAGVLGVKIDTPHDAYARLGTIAYSVPGNLLFYDGSTLFEPTTKDAGFAVSWDPNAIVVGTTNTSWGGVKALFR